MDIFFIKFSASPWCIQSCNDLNGGRSSTYTYQVSEIEVLPGTLEEAKSHTLPTDKTSITGSNLLQRVLNVNGNLILEHSKVGDENGEPLVVYHGTDAKFNVFDQTKARAKKG